MVTTQTASDSKPMSGLQKLIVAGAKFVADPSHMAMVLSHHARSLEFLCLQNDYFFVTPALLKGFRDDRLLEPQLFGNSLPPSNMKDETTITQVLRELVWYAPVLQAIIIPDDCWNIGWDTRTFEPVQFDSGVFHALNNHNDSLRYLDIHRQIGLPMGDFLHFCHMCGKDLAHLVLSNCVHLTDEDLLSIVARLTRLEKLQCALIYCSFSEENCEETSNILVARGGSFELSKW